MCGGKKSAGARKFGATPPWIEGRLMHLQFHACVEVLRLQGNVAQTLSSLARKLARHSGQLFLPRAVEGDPTFCSRRRITGHLFGEY